MGTAVVNGAGVDVADVASTATPVRVPPGPTPGRPGTPPAGPAEAARLPTSRRGLLLLGRIRVAACVLVGGFAGAVLLAGWGMSRPAFQRLGPGEATVRPVLAGCLLLLAVALALSGRRDRRPIHRVGLGCAGLVAAASVLTVLGHALGTPGLVWMPIDAAVSVAALAAAQLTAAARVEWAPAASQAVAAAAGLVGVTVGYDAAYSAALAGASSPGRQPGGMPLSAAAALIALAAGTIAARPGEGLVRVVASDSAGGMLGRRLLAAAATVPFLLGWLPVLVGQSDRYGQRVAVASLVVGNAVAFGVVSLVAASSAARLEIAETQAQRQAAEGHAQLLALIDNTSAVIYLRDLEGRYVLVNRQYEKLFGVRRESIVGLTDHDLFPKEIADDFRVNDRAAAQRGAPVSMEETAPGDDGPHTYITVKFPLLDAEGTPYAVAGISTDITARKRAEQEVQRLNAQLEERVRHRTAELEASTRELDAFAYSVSHDLRAPLRSLGGFSQLLLDDYRDRLDEAGQDYLHRLQANVARMGQMIDDLLDLSRATRLELHRQRVDLTSIAHDIVAELRAAEPDRQVEMRVADGLVAAGDPRLLRLMLQNLLANAWKFTGKRESAVVEVGSTSDSDEPAFYVRDNGAGFSMRYADKLFDPFQRLHPSAEFEGSGLGLAIVQRILRRHGGRIWADSEPDRGATFYFTLTAPLEDVRGQRRDLAGRGQPR